MRDKTFELESVTCIKETAKAILVESEELAEDGEWIPKSQVDDDSEVYALGGEGTLVISAWLARKKGWV